MVSALPAAVTAYMVVLDMDPPSATSAPPAASDMMVLATPSVALVYQAASDLVHFGLQLIILQYHLAGLHQVWNTILFQDLSLFQANIIQANIGNWMWHWQARDS
jgi:hypothetical protein